ncbi:MAG: M48 family metalloprotease [bacterium]
MSITGFGSMAASSRHTSPARQAQFTGQLKHFSSLIEQICEAESGFLDEGHEVSQYVNSRIRHIFPDAALRVRVAVSDRRPGAEALANGTLIVSVGMLDLLETQDELDFLLAHEAKHYFEGHAAQILAHKDILTKHYRVGAEKNDLLQVVADCQRIFGAKRVTEWEADIRGVHAIARSGINPAAARSFFLKIEEYEQKLLGKASKRGMHHGANWDRIINVGIVGQLVDYETSANPQVPLPAFVKTFAAAESPQTLMQKVLDPDWDESADELADSTSLNQLLLTLKDVRLVGNRSEPVEAFTKIAISAVQKKVATMCPDLEAEQQMVLAQVLLEICAGLRTDDYYDSFEAEFSLLSEAPDLETLKNRLAGLTAQNLINLGVVITDNSAVVGFFGHVLSQAQEYELFNNDQGLDVEAYLAFATDFINQLQPVTAACGFEEVHASQFTNAVLEQGIANLDLRRSKVPLTSFVTKLQQAGIPVSFHQVAKLVRREVRFEKETDLTDYLERLQKAMARTDRYLGAFFKFVDLAQDESDLALCEIAGYASTAQADGLDAQGVVAAMRALRLTNVSEMHDWFHWLADYSLRATADSRDVDGDVDFAKIMIGVMCSMMVGGHRVFSFLPADKPERLKLVVAMLRSGRSAAARSCFTKVLDELGYLQFKPREESKSLGLNDLCNLEDMLEIGQIVAGQHQIFSLNNLEPMPFRPTKLPGIRFFNNETATVVVEPGAEQQEKEATGYSALNWDDALLLGLTESYFGGLLPNELSMQQLQKAMKRYFDWAFQHVDEVPLRSSAVNRSGQIGEAYPVDVFLNQVFEHHDFKLTRKRDQDVLLSCASLMNSPSARAQLQNAVIEEKMKTASFDERLELLFYDSRIRLAMNKEMREKFIEEEVQTHEQFAKAKEALESFAGLVTEHEYAGALVLLEQFTDKIKGKRELFELFMGTGSSDQEIKETLFRLLRSDMSDEAAIIETEARLNSVYEANELVRFAMVRNFLIGDDGFLLTESNRRWLLDTLMRDHIKRPETAGETRLNEVMRDFMDALTVESDPDMLFAGLAPLLTQRIMRRPRPNKEAAWVDILEPMYGMIRPARETVQAVADIRGGKRQRVKFAGRSEEVRMVSDQQYVVSALELVKDYHRPVPPLDEWKIAGFAVEFAKSFGAPGIRFLQIIGQYVELPEELQKAFQDIYDNVKSQSKLTAYVTMEREVFNFEGLVKRVIRREGGGSLATAYLCEMHDDSQRIFKVLRPNALMYIDMTMGMLRRALAAMERKDSDRYGFAAAIADDIEGWLIEDIHYDRFRVEDPEFAVSRAAEDQGQAYALQVPQSYSVNEDGSDNIYVKSEDYVAGGVTLTRPEDVSDYDMKAGVAQIVRSYMKQITEGLVHADVTPGNYMFFKEQAKKQAAKALTAIIDRNNYIRLNDQDKAFFFSLAGMAGSVDSVLDEVFRYLRDDEGLTITGEQESDIRGEIGEVDDPAALFSQVVLRFNQAQIKLPRKITLLGKNMNGLTDLARRAGFESANPLQEAFMYSG